MHIYNDFKSSIRIIVILLCTIVSVYADARINHCESVFNVATIVSQKKTNQLNPEMQNIMSELSEQLSSRYEGSEQSEFVNRELNYLRKAKIAIAKAHNNIIVQSNAFIVMRGLKDYQNAFQDQFTQAIGQLKSNDHWIDIGSGSAKALFDFLALTKNPSIQTTAIGVTKPTAYSVLKSAYQFKRPGLLQNHRYISGKTIEELNIKNDRINPADLITDLFGAFSYSPQIDQVLFQQISMLKLGGQLFVYTPLLMQIKILDHHGNKIPIHRWLNSIPGVRVSSLFIQSGSHHHQLDEFSLLNGFMLEKVSNEFQVPSLRLINMSSEIVPERTYISAPLPE